MKKSKKVLLVILSILLVIIISFTTTFITIKIMRPDKRIYCYNDNATGKTVYYYIDKIICI